MREGLIDSNRVKKDGKLTMSKRSNAVEQMEELNDETIKNLAIKEENLAKIPPPVFTLHLLWERIKSDRTFNVRDEESYSFTENEGLYHSLMDRGLETRGSDNMSFSEQANGDLLIIGGNLRYAMMALGRENTAKERLTNNVPTGIDNPLPFSEIFGLVFTGLTRDQEISLMADHTMKKDLTEFELCKEVGEFIQATGLTDAKAAVKFGFDKNKVARLRMRYMMPTCMKEFRKEKAKPVTQPFVRIKQKQLEILYSSYLADQKAGCGYRVEGANFRKSWRDLVTNATMIPPGGVKVKSVESKDILDQVKSLPATFGNTPEVDSIGQILKWAANDATDGAVNLQNVVESIRDYCDSLRTERDTANETAEKLAVELASANDLINHLRADFDGLTVELSEVTKERDSLKERLSKKMAKN